MIKNKQQMYAMMQANAFGNHLRFWDCLEAVRQDGYVGLVGLRSKFAGGPFHYALTIEQAKTIHGDFIISETPDDFKLILQGEIQQGEHGVYLFYSMAIKPMRDALSYSGRSVEGVSATMLLKQSMTPADYDDINILFGLYPGAVIEFSTYRYNLGVVPNRNTIIWEVRNY